MGLVGASGNPVSIKMYNDVKIDTKLSMVAEVVKVSLLISQSRV